MIKIGFLLSVEGDTNEQLERNIVSTVEEYCTLYLGCADRSDANCPETSEQFMVGNVIGKLKSKARRAPGWEAGHEVTERHKGTERWEEALPGN